MKVINILIQSSLLDRELLSRFTGKLNHGPGKPTILCTTDISSILGLKDLPEDLHFEITLAEPESVEFELVIPDLKISNTMEDSSLYAKILANKYIFHEMINNHETVYNLPKKYDNYSITRTGTLSYIIRELYEYKYGATIQESEIQTITNTTSNTDNIADISDNSDTTIERLAGIITKLRSELEALKKVSTDNALKLSTLESENSELTKQNKELTQKCEMLDTIKSLFKTK